MAQICRRTLNTVTAITGPLLFEILPQSPFIVSASLSIVWTVVLILAFKARAKTVNQIIQKNIMATNSHQSCVFKIASYQLQEILAQLIENKIENLEEAETP